MTRQRAREAKWLLAGPLVPATLMGLFATFAALDHNPQGEFFEGTNFYFDSVFAVFFGWFEITYLLFFFIAAVLYGPYRLGLKHGFVARASRADDEDVASPSEVRLVSILAAAVAIPAIVYAVLWVVR